MSGILTQDSISLTESLNGVCFCYLATSSRKAGTIGRSTKHPTHSNKRADSFFLLSSVENGYWGGNAAGPRRPDVPKWTVKFNIMSLSLDTLCVSEAWNWSHMLSLVRRFYVDRVHPHETDALNDSKYKTPRSGTDSLHTLQEIRRKVFTRILWHFSFAHKVKLMWYKM